LTSPEFYYAQMENKNDKNRLHDLTLAHVAREMAEPVMTAAVWKTLGRFAEANCLFRTDDCVYNQKTKEHGLVRQVYERNGVTMYKVWLPATTGLLRWGHLVSDWPEGILELSDNLLLRSNRHTHKADRNGRRR
jgi:hypothetical protein